MVADPLPQFGHLHIFFHSVGGHLVKKAGSALARSGNPGNAYKNLVFRYVSQNFVVALTSISSVSFNSVLFNSALR